MYVETMLERFLFTFFAFGFLWFGILLYFSPAKSSFSPSWIPNSTLDKRWHICYTVIYCSPVVFLWFYYKYMVFESSVSFFFIMLVCFITPICIYFGLHYKNFSLYCYLFFALAISLMVTFLTTNILIFYISFEVVTILMYLILIYFGYEQRRVLASYYFFYFTFFGSFLFLGGVIIISFFFGTDLNLLAYFAPLYSLKYKHYLWWAFFFAFAIKIPMFPFHIWLPEAHVEAPTGGSVMLASVLLKVGYYGFYKIMIPLFFPVFQTYLPLLYTLCFLGITHSMIVSLRQKDLKRIIAYSSIAHMNFALLGLFSLNLDGLTGSFLLMLAHGFTSAGLFAIVGFLYQRFNTRSLDYYSGLFAFMPKMAIFFFLLILANISFPLTLAFPAEVLIIISLLKASKLIFLLVIPGLVLNLINSILLFSRIFFGSAKPYFFKVTSNVDLVPEEAFLISYLLLWLLVFGIFPDLIMNTVPHSSYFMRNRDPGVNDLFLELQNYISLLSYYGR